MNQNYSPMLDGHLQDQIHTLTQEMRRRLNKTQHKIASISHHSDIHITTIRRIKSGEQATTSPRTLDALVNALDKLDKRVE